MQEQSRGSFSSTEVALQNFFELLAYVLTIALPRVSEWRYPVLVSGIVVLVAGVVYASYLRARRGHLVHIPCVKSAVQVEE